MYNFPLLPRHGVNLFAPNGGGERFARLFRETWRRLPLFVRRRLLKHWRCGLFPGHDFSPFVVLASDWPGRVRDAMGAAGDRGHRLCFWTEGVADFPDELVMDLVAHELAHAYQWACDRRAEMDSFEAEDDANWTMECWGFSATAMDDWALEKGIIKPIGLDAMIAQLAGPW